VLLLFTHSQQADAPYRTNGFYLLQRLPFRHLTCV
jgi:hypothetical protein